MHRSSTQVRRSHKHRLDAQTMLWMSACLRDSNFDDDASTIDDIENSDQLIKNLADGVCVPSGVPPRQSDALWHEPLFDPHHDLITTLSRHQPSSDTTFQPPLDHF